MSEVNTILDEVKELTNEFERQRKKLVERLEPNFASLFTPVFANGEVKAVVFEAYTPYFNDGDTCEYSVGDLRIVLHSDDEDDFGYYEYGHDSYAVKYGSGLSTETKEQLTRAFETLDPIDTAFRSIPDDVIEALFGDHIRVKITADGIETEDYEHD